MVMRMGMMVGLSHCCSQLAPSSSSSFSHHNSLLLLLLATNQFHPMELGSAMSKLFA
jgi:hypothetical protein